MRDDDDWQDWTTTCRALATYWRAEQVSYPPRISARKSSRARAPVGYLIDGDGTPSWLIHDVGAFEH